MDTRRRDLLRFSPLAIAAVATTIGRSALAQSSVAAETEKTFSVRTYGATGDGKTVDTPAINRAIEAVAGRGAARSISPREPIYASRFTCTAT
jgi:polygalacturonase